MTRRFTHLSEVEIRQIIVAKAAGASDTSIAADLQIDRSTVSYHFRRHQAAYDEEGTVYSVIRARMRETCSHPSLKCFLCGKGQDHVKREDRLEIQRLKGIISRQELTLRQHGLCVESCPVQ